VQFFGNADVALLLQAVGFTAGNCVCETAGSRSSRTCRFSV
jgi:hypothetical protein